MSSFIHSPKHFTSVQNSLRTHIIFRDLYSVPYSIQKRFPELDYMAKYKEEKTTEILNGIFNELLKLSIEAVNKQYAHHEEYANADINQEYEILKADKVYRDRKGDYLNLTAIELFKALQSIRYQIELDYIKAERLLTESEENAIYFLDEIIIYTALYCLTNQEEYRSANSWSID